MTSLIIENKGYDVKFDKKYVKSNYFEKPIFELINK